MLFQGSMTAIITPFKNERVDEAALRRMIDWQILSGTDVIVPCGTTGESATITHEEHDRIIRITVEQVAGRALVLAGAGSNATATAIKLAHQARAARADGQLQVTPYYNKPTQEGLYQHFRAIAMAVDLPMVLYNVPGRTAVNMSPKTVLRLAEIDTIAGIKEASGKIDQIKEIVSGAPKNFGVYSGDDAMNFDIYMAGGRGCISVTANVVPDRVAAVWDAYARGRIDDAQRLHDALAQLNRAMFLETNPIPAKTALAMLGRCRGEFRLPLTPMADGTRQELIAILRQSGIIT